MLYLVLIRTHVVQLPGSNNALVVGAPGVALNGTDQASSVASHRNIQKVLKRVAELLPQLCMSWPCAWMSHQLGLRWRQVAP